MATVQVVIASISEEEVAEAGRVLGAAFASSPLERAVRGPIDDRQRRGLTLAYTATCRLAGQVSAARIDGRIVGVVRWVGSPACQLTVGQKLAMTPTAVSSFGRNIFKAMRWVRDWSGRDPSERHVHLGPIGVVPELQGRGIGSQMLGAYCDQLDAAGDVGYLETDQRQNVRLYQRFGFVVVAEGELLGVPNWFMSRPTRTTISS